MTEVNYTFNKEKRYLTQGINRELPFELQIYIWNLVDQLVESTETVDYLQVIHMTIEGNSLIIKHSQEQPEYVKEHRLAMKDEYREVIGRKIYLIDDIDHSTMLWSNEY